MRLSNEHGYFYNGRTYISIPTSNGDLETSTSRQDKTCVDYQGQDKWTYYCDRTILQASEDYLILVLWFQTSYEKMSEFLCVAIQEIKVFLFAGEKDINTDTVHITSC